MVNCLNTPRKMGKRKITEKERNLLLRWNRFLEEQGGCYPATLAAIKLEMSTAGVYQAAERGWLSYFQMGRDRWYGRKDVSRYHDCRHMKSASAAFRSGGRKDCTNDDDGGRSRNWSARQI